jgi:hypothetical protein
VVGRANGNHFGIKTLRDWVESYWTNSLEQLALVQTLSKEWFILKFKKVEDTKWVLKSPWSIDSSLVLLKKWTLLFDAGCEKVDKLLIWVHFPSLPIELWTKEGFRCLGNALGTFIDADMYFISTSKMSIAIFLVHINVSKGLARKWSFPGVVKLLCRIWIIRGYPFAATDATNMAI